jgi:serine/threonine-protein kinase
MRLSTGTRVGKYEIIAPLGEGGMARVYLALARGPAAFDKLVVLKQIRPEYAADAEFLSMFFDESRIAARLHHPNVIHTYEDAEQDEDYLLVME